MPQRIILRWIDLVVINVHQRSEGTSQQKEPNTARGRAHIMPFSRTNETSSAHPAATPASAMVVDFQQNNTQWGAIKASAQQCSTRTTGLILDTPSVTILCPINPILVTTLITAPLAWSVVNAMYDAHIPQAFAQNLGRRRNNWEKSSVSTKWNNHAMESERDNCKQTKPCRGFSNWFTRSSDRNEM